MLTGEKLTIFESFKVDKNLPKYKESEQNSNRLIYDSSGITVGGNTVIRGDGLVEEFTEASISYLEYLREQLKRFDISIFQKIKFTIILLIATLFFKSKKKNVIEKKNYDSVAEFFKTIKNNKLELQHTNDIVERYEFVLTEAKKNGQQSLVEKLLNMKDVISSEARLIDNGIVKFVEEEQVVKLFKQTNKDKSLKMTYMDNYIRVIPTDVIKLKEIADKLKVFDNYVILHYDPLGIATEMTHKEKEKAKDPILFGIIQGSRKLYFIGDWVDDYCDLTLEKMMKTIKDKEHILSSESVISYINAPIK